MGAIDDAGVSPSIEAYWWAKDLHQADPRCVRYQTFVYGAPKYGEKFQVPSEARSWTG
jgi:hypothetical protein